MNRSIFKMFNESEVRFLTAMRVARLATADASGQPHVIPIVFAFDGQRIYTPIDEKPKRVEPERLKRVRNLLENDQLAIVVDRYDEDWTQLAWVLVTGTGEFVEEGEQRRTGIKLLKEKYPQYEDMPLEGRPLIVVTPHSVTSWGDL